MIYILSIYRAPVGNFSHFLNGLDSILKSPYNVSVEFVICGATNLNYFDDIVIFINLFSTVYFLLELKKIQSLQLIILLLILSGNYALSSLLNRLVKNYKHLISTLE
jgi:hypothetical protein